MARLNLTIPDSLYVRLERFRDRVNVSKVCAIALAKELDMLEGTSTTVAANPKAQRMIERLQGRKDRKDRWFQHGYEDGEDWAAEVASPHELRFVLDEWDVEDEEEYRLHDQEFPASFDARAAVERWARADQPFEEGETKVHPSDEDAYLRGWYRAIQDIWKVVKPALRWVE
jgi:hypothetical protein